MAWEASLAFLILRLLGVLCQKEAVGEPAFSLQPSPFPFLPLCLPSEERPRGEGHAGPGTGFVGVYPGNSGVLGTRDHAVRGGLVSLACGRACTVILSKAQGFQVGGPPSLSLKVTLIRA